MRKIMIGLLAFALIACGVVAITAVADEETDAANTKEYSKVFKTDGTETIDISTNEASYKLATIYGTVEVKWTYKDGTWKDVTLGDQFTIGVWKYTLTNAGDGLYKLSMETDSETAATVLEMNYTLTVKPNDGAPVEYAMDVVVNISKNGSALPDNLGKTYYGFFVDTTISRTDGKLIPRDSDNVELNPANYKWSARSLPEGVSITADGYLSGIPKKISAATYDIYAEDPFGNIGKYQVDIMVGNRIDGLTFFVHKGVVDGFNAGTAHPIPKVSAVQTGDEAYLVISSLITDVNKVTAVGDSGTREVLTGVEHNVGGYDYKFYTLPTGLTGAYSIIIETTTNVYSTTLYVLPQLDVVVAGIGVSSSSNANNGGGN